MKKITALSIFVFALMMLASCGEQKKEKSENTEPMVTVETVKIKGPLGAYFEVVAKDYKIKIGDYKNLAMFEIKRIAEGLPEPWTKDINLNDYDINFDIDAELFDDDGFELDKEYLSIDADELIGLNVGESVSCECRINNKILKEVVSAKFISKFSMEKKEQEVFSDDEISSLDDEDLEKTLKDMDKVVDVTKSAASAIKDMAGALK